MIKYHAITEVLKAKRLEKNLTQREVAAAVRMNSKKPFGRAYYGHIEDNRQSADLDLAIAIARIFDSELDELFTVEES